MAPPSTEWRADVGTNLRTDTANEERTKEKAGLKNENEQNDVINHTKRGCDDVTKLKKKKESDLEVPDDGVPYDRGWAWMIVLSGFVCFVVSAGYNRATFIFFVNFLEEFHAPVSETALLFGVKAGINSIVGLFVMNAVVGRLGVRKTILMGGVCLSLSAVLGSFATNITSLIFSQAVFHGLGLAMLNMPITVLIGFYFRRRRSLANSVTKTGVGVGAMVFPPIVTALNERFGMRGSLLIMGGVCLNTLAAGALLRPTSFYKKRRGLRSETTSSAKGKAQRDCNLDFESTANPTIEETKTTNMDGGQNRSLKLPSETSSVGDADSLYVQVLKACELDGKRPTKAGDEAWVVDIREYGDVPAPFSHNGKGSNWLLLAPTKSDKRVVWNSTPELYGKVSQGRFPQPLLRTYSVNERDMRTIRSSHGHLDNVLDAMSVSRPARYLSALDLEYDNPCVTSHGDSTEASDTEDDTGRLRTNSTCAGSAWRVAKKVVGVLDFSLFHSPMFRLLVVFFCFSPMIHATTTYLPAMAQERGLSKDQAATLLSIIGGLDIVCRMMCGYIADLKVLKVSTIISIGVTILGVVCQLTRLLTTFPLLIGLAVVIGLLGGVAACLTAILIMEDIGLENTAKAMGFHKLFGGAAMACLHPFLGYLRDVTGSYDVCYNVIGGFTLVSAVVIFCLRFMPHTPTSYTMSRERTVEYGVSTTEESSPLNHDDLNNGQQPKAASS